MTMEPASIRLRKRLDSIQNDLEQLIAGLKIIREAPIRGVVNFGPQFYFDTPSPQACALQLQIKREYDQLIALLKVMLRGMTGELAAQFEEAEHCTRTWVELSENHDIGRTSRETIAAIKSHFRLMHKITDIIGAAGNGEILVVPDTNVLVGHPDPASYRKTVGSDSFILLLLPTVLAELDDLKNNHRNPDFREKVNSAIRRIKGWKAQGSLIRGVTVDKTITVRALADEPSMKDSLPWLDDLVQDDRIIASVLELQARKPNATVVLVTGDINLQNKSEVAAIHAIEFED